MKILFYNHTGQVSGAERLLLTILSRLDRDRFDAIVLCPESGPLQAMAVAHGVRTETLTQLNARFTWRVNHFLTYLKSFAEVIRDFRRVVLKVAPDLVHANSVRAGLVAIAGTIGLGIPVVWHLHDLMARHPLSSMIRLVAACSRRTRFIAISQAAAISFLGRFSWMMRDRVEVILNGIDLNKFGVDETACPISEDLGKSPDVCLLGIVGQLTPGKGQLELIRALARCGLSHLRLVIVGAPLFAHDQEYARALEEEAKSLGLDDRVRFLGPRADISTVMKALDLLIVNSRAEAFGLVLLEAMACGTPVLATNAGGIPEIITHGENGWLVPARDEQALADAIVYLSKHDALRSRLAEKGKQRVNSRFTIDRLMKELQTFYESTLDGQFRSAKSRRITISHHPERAVAKSRVRGPA